MKYLNQFQINRIISLLRCLLNLNDDTANLTKRLIDTYVKLITKRVSSEGTRNTVKWLKEVHLLSVKLSVGVPFEPIP
jgi:hypothetical protein